MCTAFSPLDDPPSMQSELNLRRGASMVNKKGIVLFHPDDIEYNPQYRPRSASLAIGKIHSVETHTTRASLHDKPRRRGSSNFTDDVDFVEPVDDCPVLQEPSKLHDKWKRHFTRLWLKLLRTPS